MDRRCPRCGEPVPTNCITCPKCYAKMPTEPVSRRFDVDSIREKMDWTPKPDVAVLLGVVFGFVGLPGIGHLYLKNTDRALKFLPIGFVLFYASMLLLCWNAVGTVFAVPILVIYIIIYLASLIDLLLLAGMLRFGFRSC